MVIKKQYLQKYLHDIAIDQIVEEYEEKGYTVSKEEQLGTKYKADIIARKGAETIVVEVKSGKMSPDRNKQIADLANYVKEQGNYKFLVVIATPPKDKKLGITDVEVLLTDNLLRHADFQKKIRGISDDTRLEKITSVDIYNILIDGPSIFVSGEGVLSLQLHFNTNDDQTPKEIQSSYDSFSFDFEISLEYDPNHKLKIAKVGKLEIDTSFL